MVKKRIAAVFLIALSVLCFLMIFGFSEENSDTSDKTSMRVTETVLNTFVKDYPDLPEKEKTALTDKYNPPIRKLAHFSEYAVLGVLLALTFLCFDKTKKKFYLFSAALSFILASSDEIHQFFVPGRACRFTDVLLDTFGAAIGAAVIILIRLIFKKKKTL